MIMVRHIGLQAPHRIYPKVKRREEQQKLLALVKKGIELMPALEMDGMNSYINKAGMEMLGFESKQQVLKTPISHLYTPEDIVFVEQTVVPSVMTTGSWSGSMFAAI